MAQQKVESMLKPKVTPTLGLLGATVNAMALIAPGAFLWITYQLQAAATLPTGTSCASDIWGGIVVALAVCFLTALSYAELAKIKPVRYGKTERGAGYRLDCPVQTLY